MSRRIAVILGGRSSENPISVASAQSVITALELSGNDVVTVEIDRAGRWALESGRRALEAGSDSRLPATEVAATLGDVDVVFPVLHGPFGEDGTVQGLLELAGVPYVGAGVLASALCMDKDVFKSVMRDHGIPVTENITLRLGDEPRNPYGYPCFVKPARLGSSVGISKAHDRKELRPALDEAAKYDRKLVVEQGVSGKKSPARELEVAVLGNDDPKASVVGEIIPGKEFYDYEAKYLSEGSVPVIPAKLTGAEAKKIREMAIAAFRACDLAGLARVDFLMEPDGKRRMYINEVNTLPGFTQISMYPKLWEASGTSYRDLISRLIDLALERQKEKERNRYSKD